jgi:muramoyltetrapeptide carboxypeptidase
MSLENPRQFRSPAPLMQGDTIGVIAPAGVVDRAALETGCSHLRALGHPTVYLESICEQDQYFAGSVDRRVNEIHEMFRREDVKAIVAARGGYGCNYLLPFLDLDLIANNFKAFVGYSDLTTLHTWFNDHGLQTFHGPMVSKDFAHADGVEITSWREALRGERFNVSREKSETVQIVCKGEAEGPLYGGCLSMLVQSLGTPYEMHPEGCILFVEDISVWPYQVDRMLMHLKLAGKFDKIRGLIFGDMAQCAQAGLPDYTVSMIARRLLGDLGIPVVVGLKSGHVEQENITLPLGRAVKLTATEEGFSVEMSGAIAGRVGI